MARTIPVPIQWFIILEAYKYKGVALFLAGHFDLLKPFLPTILPHLQGGPRKHAV
jgi:hypothetical protein